MAQGEFTDDLFKGIPKSKVPQYLGHLNDISLFLSAAKRAAPAEAVKQPKTRKGSK